MSRKADSKPVVVTDEWVFFQSAISFIEGFIKFVKDLRLVNPRKNPHKTSLLDAQSLLRQLNERILTFVSVPECKFLEEKVKEAEKWLSKARTAVRTGNSSTERTVEVYFPQ